MSKRSKIALGALMGFSALTLAACKEEKSDAQVFSSMEQCLAEVAKPASWWTEEECNSAFETAQKRHTENAPRYDALAVCEAEHGSGACAADSSGGGGGSVFLPLMAGYMMGSMLSNNRSSYATSRPIYPTKSGQFATADGGVKFSGNSGSTKLSSTALKPAPKTLGKAPMSKATVTKVGGFGKSRTSFSGRSGGFGG